MLEYLLCFIRETPGIYFVIHNKENNDENVETIICKHIGKDLLINLNNQ